MDRGHLRWFPKSLYAFVWAASRAGSVEIDERILMNRRREFSWDGPTVRCECCQREVPYRRGRYEAQPVRAWHGIMICHVCRGSSHDGIVPGGNPIFAELARRGIKYVLNGLGRVDIPR